LERGGHRDDGFFGSRLGAHVLRLKVGALHLVILYAQDLTCSTLATVHLPHSMPFGFHGNWLPDAN
jgi:8'-apo-carotenoid 13,14-cleaving dioxygenase